ncbi:hypothetical protein [Roseomonas genomospecies 6]|uniref:hypothetical protein n=1 Tax=Roseomonas genomospecies 6 TaxID=214106 RepID=UPI0011F19669|nr:hypothetical protein [Roseomonas genomospecies 6]
MLFAYRRARRARWVFHYLTPREREDFYRDLEPEYLERREDVLSWEREVLEKQGLKLLDNVFLQQNHKELLSIAAYATKERKNIMLRRGGGSLKYNELSPWLGCVETSNPRADLYFAYRQLRAFHCAAKAAPAYFDRLCSGRDVPASRKHAVPATRLVKLVLGEPCYPETPGPPDRLVWVWDDRLVNKVASVLTLADQDDVAPADMPAWIKAQGGIQACLNRFRQSDT